MLKKYFILTFFIFGSQVAMTGAQILVKALQDLGVSHVFGYTGAAILPVIDEIGKSDIQFIVNTNEQSAAFSATGYSRASNVVGVAVVTSGPAITNTLTAVCDANADGIPLVVIAGQVPEHKIGTDSFQHINVSDVFRAAAKKVILIQNAAEIEQAIKDAYFFAKSGKPGPVVIDFPVNFQKEAAEYQSLPLDVFQKAYANENHLTEQQCEQFFALIAEAKRPLLYVGGGLNNEKTSALLRAFIEKFPMPSVNTLMGKGTIDENDEKALGMLGMFGTPYANKIIQENDLFIALGVRWDDRVAEKVGFAIDAKIAYIDINPEKIHQIHIERNPEFIANGDAQIFLQDLLDYAEKHAITADFSEWTAHAIHLKKSWPLNYNKETEKIQEAHVLEILNQKLPKESFITTGVGNHQMLAAQYLRMSSPRRFLTSGGFGTMGFGLPNAIGAQFVNPNSLVVCIDGDGSLKMNLGELYTIGTLHLPIKVLVLNNMSDCMVRNLEIRAFEGRHSATERAEDVCYADLAKVCGFGFAQRVTEKSALDDAITAFLSSTGPAFLEVMTDIEELFFPVVPVGKGYHEMIVGPYIKEVSA